MIKPCGCPILDPNDWELKKHVWQEKAFYVARHKVACHVPIGIEKAYAEAMDGIKAKGYKLPDPCIMVDTETGMFSAKVMIELAQVPSADSHVEVLRDATVLSKYFNGEFKDMAKPVKELVAFAKAQKGEPKQIYCWYATCPKCWDEGGKVTVIFAEV